MAMSEHTIRQQARRGDLARPSGGGDDAEAVNVGARERVASVVAGAGLAVYGITRGTLGGLALALLGGSLVYRGVSGHCPMYGALGIDRREHDDEVTGNLGIKIERSVVVEASPERAFAFWRNLENLPRIMANVESVRVLNPTRSRWTVKGPAGQQPQDLKAIEALGAAWYPLQMARELEDAILHLRSNELEIGTWLLKTEGRVEDALALDALLEVQRGHWLVRETIGLLRRTLARLDVSSRSMFALIERGSCFA